MRTGAGRGAQNHEDGSKNGIDYIRRFSLSVNGQRKVRDDDIDIVCRLGGTDGHRCVYYVVRNNRYNIEIESTVSCIFVGETEMDTCYIGSTSTCVRDITVRVTRRCIAPRCATVYVSCY